MSEEKQEAPAAAAPARNTSDLRTFLIALLTSIIVLAFYHLGLGLVKIYCPCSSECMMPTPRYMLVPVMEPRMMAPRGMPGRHFGPGGREFRPQNPGGPRQPAPQNCYGKSAPSQETPAQDEAD